MPAKPCRQSPHSPSITHIPQLAAGCLAHLPFAWVRPEQPQLIARHPDLCEPVGGLKAVHKGHSSLLARTKTKLTHKVTLYVQTHDSSSSISVFTSSALVQQLVRTVRRCLNCRGCQAVKS